MVNLSDGADVGEALSSNASIPNLKEKMLKLNRTNFTAETDPMFFLYLERLSMAEKSKGGAEDRVDGRRALNDFILEKNSLSHTKQVKKAEAMKQQYQK